VLTQNESRQNCAVQFLHTIYARFFHVQSFGVRVDGRQNRGGVFTDHSISAHDLTLSFCAKFRAAHEPVPLSFALDFVRFKWKHFERKMDVNSET